jgi:Mediator of RNA polymerase II transcription complex subunit 8.
MQREEKQLESSLESVVMKLNEIKSQLVGMLFKIDHDRDSLNWPTFLDNFALLSGQVNS